jgi:hypothetical protein
VKGRLGRHYEITADGELPTYGSASMLSIGNVTVTEGSGGTGLATFTVTLLN